MRRGGVKLASCNEEDEFEFSVSIGQDKILTIPMDMTDCVLRVRNFEGIVNVAPGEGYYRSLSH